MAVDTVTRGEKFAVGGRRAGTARLTSRLIDKTDADAGRVAAVWETAHVALVAKRHRSATVRVVLAVISVSLGVVA